MLGIVLYELCTVRRLFKADTKFDTMNAIVSGDVPPPSKFRKDLPEELEKIILKALAPDPSDRYQTADDLRLVLEAFAMRSNMTISSTRLSDYMKDLFGERPLPWLVEELPPMPDLQMVRMRDSQPVLARSSSLSMEPGSGNVGEGPSESTPMAWSPQERRGKPGWFWPTIAVAIIAVGAGVGYFTLQNQKQQLENAASPGPTPVVEKGVVDPPPATLDAGVQQTAVAAPADAAVEAVATPDAGVEVAAKPDKPKPKPRPRPRPRPGQQGGGGEDLDNPFPH